jgi:PAS domain S-box-containing protein
MPATPVTAGPDVAMDTSSGRYVSWRTPSSTAERGLAALRATAIPLIAVFLAYLVAGKLGQATTTIRSSNLGPVWPAYGIALAAFLMYGSRVWPAVTASAFLVALQGSVSPLAAAGQATGATLAAATGALVLRRIPRFDPSLSRLRDAIGFIVLGAFGSALVSSLIGVSFLYATGIQAYAGLPSSWLIYWLGDSTGVLLVTPLAFTVPAMVRGPSRARVPELTALVALLTATCLVVFADWPVFPVRLHVMAFAVLPFVMWGAIRFGIGGAALCVLWVATIATVLTALGSGPFAANTPFINAVLLDVLFVVLSATGLMLAAVITERERAESEREALIREQAATETRTHLAAIVESSEDAIWSEDLNGRILSWNAAAHRIFGFTAEEAIGQPVTILFPPERREEETRILHPQHAGDRIVQREMKAVTKAGTRLTVSLSVSPLRNAAGESVGLATIARDTSEQQRARAALAAVNRRLIEAQEQERARIARELHDDIGQRIALLALEMTPEAFEGRSEAVRLQVSEIAADVHALSHNLHSPKLELLGIAEAARLFCDEFAGQHNVTIAFTTCDVPAQVPATTALSVFRILQEALQNSARHSGVRHFEVQLWGTQNDIHLLIRDRGKGFDLAAAMGSTGIGLVGMQERIKLVAGDLSIDSRPHEGTTIHAQAPLSLPGSTSLPASPL